MPKPGGGVRHYGKTGGLGGEAEWIWNPADLHFPGAIQIVDLYHSRQPLRDLSAQLFPNDSPAPIEALIGSSRSVASSHPELTEEIGTKANYFESNKESMRDPEFRRQGLFVGSGVIAAACKTVQGG
jgi:hypothetical protein